MKYGISCPGCGAAVNEDISQATLQCQYCGNTFSTPEHDGRHRHHMEHSYLRESLDEQRRHTEMTERSSRRSITAAIAAPIAGFFAGLIGRVLQFALGLILVGLSIPMIMQYGFLKTLAEPSGLPQSISSETFEERVLNQIKDEASKNILLKHYVENAGVFEIKPDLDFEQKKEVQQSLAESGYTVSGLYRFFFNLPVLGSMYTSYAANASYLHNQIIAALVLGLGLALIKRRK